MRKSILKISFVTFLIIGVLFINAEYTEYLSIVHNPTVSASAPSIVSFDTGGMSSLDNPALSICYINSSFTGVYYVNNYRYDLNSISVKTHYSNTLGLSLSAFKYNTFNALQGIIANISLRNPLDVLLGVNVKYLRENEYEWNWEKFNYDTIINHEVNVDIGIHYSLGFSAGGIENKIMTGLSAINFLPEKTADIDYRGGITYQLIDNDNKIKVIDQVTIALEGIERVVIDSMGRTPNNYLTLVCALKMIDVLTVRLGYTSTCYESWIPSLTEDGDYCINYGFDTEIPLNSVIASKYNPILRISFAKANEYFDEYHNSSFLIEGPTVAVAGFGYSIGAELSIDY